MNTPPPTYIIETVALRDDRGIKISQHTVIAGDAPDDFARFTITLQNVIVGQDVHGNQAIVPGPFIVMLDAATPWDAFLIAPEKINEAVAMLRKKGGEALLRSQLTIPKPGELEEFIKRNRQLGT